MPPISRYFIPQHYFHLQGAKGAKAAKAAKKTSAGGAGGDDIYIDTEEGADGKGPEAKGSGRGAKVHTTLPSLCFLLPVLV